MIAATCRGRKEETKCTRRVVTEEAGGRNKDGKKRGWPGLACGVPYFAPCVVEME
jgi:hypothetical protein